MDDGNSLDDGDRWGFGGGLGLGSGLAELGAKAGFGFGDGSGASGGDEFLEMGRGLGSRLLQRLGPGSANSSCNLLAMGLLLLEFRGPSLLVSIHNFSQLLGERLTLFFLFGFDKLSRRGGEAEVLIVDGLFDGKQLRYTVFLCSVTGLGA